MFQRFTEINLIQSHNQKLEYKQKLYIYYLNPIYFYYNNKTLKVQINFKYNIKSNFIYATEFFLLSDTAQEKIHEQYFQLKKNMQFQLMQYNLKFQFQYEFKDAVYFTRAFYNTKSEEFLPEISKWPKVCYCKKPQNPDLPYVFCDMCNQWIHLKCEGLTEEQVQNIESFICTYCKGK
ncbi:unnamed protein product [Paramecium primaurelia]|uniref:PHD-type domain-containing protein n=1 Tax=Paramecium primaurelia TaxID=5886 RepID=A0A8S1LAN1_PARPR|nr:unnamed protein product [Paramecium primaurelia]